MAHPLADVRDRGAFNERLKDRGVPAKACASCLAVKASVQFAPYARTKLDGRRPSCRACRGDSRAARAESIREQKRVYHAANRDQVNAHRRDRYPEIAERERRRNQVWAAENPDKVHAKASRRRAVIADATVTPFTPRDLRADWEDHDLWDCFFCAGPLTDMEEEHFYPLTPAFGVMQGAHAVENLVPACRGCNRAKGNRDPWEFLRDRLSDRSNST